MGEEQQQTQNLLWNSDFTVLIKMRGKQQLKYIPDYIFSVKLPSIQLLPLDGQAGFDPETSSVGQMSLVVRTDKERNVVSEILAILASNWFDISVFSPKTQLAWEFKTCSLERFEPCELVSKKKYDSPYNIELPISVKTAIYYGHGVRFIYGADEKE